MHGIKRVYQSHEAINARKLREQAKLQEYLTLTEDVLSRKKNQECSPDALHLTSRLLQINPEFYTIWNYRRTIFLRGIFPTSSPEDINDHISNDLSMTMAGLKAHPKVYWLWNHRRWCLENVPSGPGLEGEGSSSGWKEANWNKELYVVEKMLDADPRNFHAWDYRRYILANMSIPKSEKNELAYTTRKIEANFSNFSAWHQRSKVLFVLWNDGNPSSVKSREDEFELVRNAMYTDPNDQSVWIYHRWLIGSGDDKELLEREILAIQELLDEQPDSKWCMESIVHYKRMLLKNHSTSVDVVALSIHCKYLLERLQLLDPSRKHRYRELAEAMNHL